MTRVLCRSISTVDWFFRQRVVVHCGNEPSSKGAAKLWNTELDVVVDVVSRTQLYLFDCAGLALFTQCYFEAVGFSCSILDRFLLQVQTCVFLWG